MRNDHNIQYMKGGFYLSLVIIIWELSAILIQKIFESNDTKFDKPLFLTLYNTSFFMIYLIPVCFRYTQNTSDDYSTYDDDEEKKVVNYGLDQIKESALFSLEFCILWLLSNYFYNLGLSTTSISASTVLTNTSSIFVYLLSFIFFDNMNFHAFKALMVLLSFTGLILTTLFTNGTDQSFQQNQVLGDIYSIISATSYAVYCIFLKKKIPIEKESSFNFSQFLGFVGFFNFLLGIPLLLIFNFTSLEKFELPNQQTFMFLSINAILGTVISDFCWAKSVVLLGPLIPTLGITLTIPISLLIDIFYLDYSYRWEFFLGALLIVLAFFIFSYIEYNENTQKQLEYQDDKQQTDIINFQK